MALKKRNSETGYTLIELLVAAAIMAIVMGAVFIAMSQTLFSIEHGEEYLSRIRMVDVALNRLQREIMSAFVPLDDQSIRFVGRDFGSDEMAEDTLEFLTKSGKLVYLSSSGLYKVTYSLRDVSDREGKELVWTGVPMRGDEEGEEKELVLGDGIKAFDIQYYYSNDWVDSYDASSRGFLPRAVKIKLGVITPKGVDWQELIIEIPAGGQKVS